MKKISLLITLISFLSLDAFAQDIYIDSAGNMEIGTINPSARLEVEGSTMKDAIVGYSSGSRLAIYGENLTTGNFGMLGDLGFGIYGYSETGYAGFFQGDARVTGILTVDGLITGTGLGDITEVNAGIGLIGGGTEGSIILDVSFDGTGTANTTARSDHNHDTVYSTLLHNHSGNDINSGTVSEVYIDTEITRDTEIMPIVLASDGSGSGLDADRLDGQESSSFASSAYANTLDQRISSLESQSGGASNPPTSSIITAASVAADETCVEKPELEIWMRAVQKGGANNLYSGFTEVDSNGDGMIIAGTDLTNLQLAAAGVVTTFVAAKTAMGEVSPWNAALPLWANGGVAASQAACDAVAAGIPGQIQLCFTPAEDHTIVTLFVSASDDLGNIVYRKYVRGIIYDERLDDLLNPLEEALPELEIWMRAAQKGGANNPLNGLTEVDSNGDGMIIAGTDLTNLQLAAAGVVTAFVAAKTAMGEVSPWNAALPLWANSGVVPNQAACNAVATANTGQISMCYTPAENQTIGALFLSASNNNGAIVFRKHVIGITNREKLDSALNSIGDGLPELDKWILAGKKAGTAEGTANEIDTDGSGIIDANDLDNNNLAASGIITTFVSSRIMMYEVSPWNSALPLWANGGVAASQAACDAVATANPGQLTLCYYPAENQTMETVFVSASDGNAAIFYRKIIYAN